MEAVEFKGNREGLVVILDSSLEFDYLCEKIKEKIKAADSFLGTNTEIILSLGDNALDFEKRDLLKKLFNSFGMITKKIIPPLAEQYAGNIAEDLNVIKGTVVDSDSILTKGPTLVVRKNLRSGQTLSHAGTVIILGDINPGAEVVAEGHIFVVGSIRGVAHAGSNGDRKALVFASRLQPTQLRIADMITRAPDGDQLIPKEPEIARIKDNRMIIEKYI